MEHNISLIKALITTLKYEVESIKGSEELIDEPVTLSEKVREYEIKLIRAALARTGGNQRQAAKLLNIQVTTLNTKIKQYSIAILKRPLSDVNQNTSMAD